MKRLLVLSLLLALPTVAAHAEPFESDPAGGSRLDASPDLVRVSFTEPVFREGSWIRVVDANGARVDNGDLRIEGETRPVMTVSVADLPDGAYRIAWQTYSVTDGHTVKGSIGFAVGGFAPPANEVQEEAAFDAIPSMARGLIYAGFSIGLGFLVYAWAMRTAPLVGTLQIGAGTALLGTLILTWDTFQGTGLSLSTYLASEGGTRMANRVMLLTSILGGTMAWAAWAPRSKKISALVGIGWLIAAYQSASWGHVTQHGSWGLWLELVHLIAAAVWIGGLASLWWHLRSAQADWFETGKQFGRIAATCVVALAVTGLLLAWLLLKDAYQLNPASIANDSWTWFLGVKLSAFLLMLAAASVNRYGYLSREPKAWLKRLAPRRGSDGFRRVVRWEATTAAIALLGAGLLLSVSPPQAIAAEPGAFQVTAPRDAFTVLAEITPEPQAGATHVLRFYINDPEEGQPVTNNTCGRSNCIKARWISNDDAGTEQEATAYPEGDGWWRIDSALFTEPGLLALWLDVQTGYVYLDSIRFEPFNVV